MLTDRQVKFVAHEMGLSPGAIRRLFGAISVEVSSQFLSREEESPSLKILNLGFRLDALRDDGVRVRFCERSFVDTLLEYRRLCPVVFSWMVSGGFDPEKSPEKIDRGKMAHANRTVGRLRAEYLRKVQLPHLS